MCRLHGGHTRDREEQVPQRTTHSYALHSIRRDVCHLSFCTGALMRQQPNVRWVDSKSAYHHPKDGYTPQYSPGTRLSDFLLW